MGGDASGPFRAWDVCPDRGSCANSKCYAVGDENDLEQRKWCLVQDELVAQKCPEKRNAALWRLLNHPDLARYFKVKLTKFSARYGFLDAAHYVPELQLLLHGRWTKALARGTFRKQTKLRGYVALTLKGMIVDKFNRDRRYFDEKAASWEADVRERLLIDDEEEDGS